MARPLQEAHVHIFQADHGDWSEGTGITASVRGSDLIYAPHPSGTRYRELPDWGPTPAAEATVDVIIKAMEKNLSETA